MSKQKTIVFLSLVLAMIMTVGGAFVYSQNDSQETSTPEANALTTNWDQVNTDRFGQPNERIPAGTTYFPIHQAGNYMFAGAQGESDPIRGVLWKYEHVGGGSPNQWTSLTRNGCGNTNNQYFTDLEEFNGDLIAVSYNPIDGQMVYKIDPNQSTCDASDLISSGTFGIMVDIRRVNDLFVFNNKLYALGEISADLGVRIMRYDGGTTWTTVKDNGLGSAIETLGFKCDTTSQAVYCSVNVNSTNESRIYRSTNLSSWTKIGSDNFGDSNNIYFPDVMTLNSDVYISTLNTTSTQVWKYSESSSSLSKVSSSTMEASAGGVIALGEMNGLVYAGVSKAGGLSVYRYQGTGTSWDIASTAGFGDTDNVGQYWFANYKNNLYAAVVEQVEPAPNPRVYRFRDSIAPTYLNKNPANGATNVAKDANLTFQVFDDETGNNITGLNVTVTGSQSGAHTYVKSESLLPAAPSTNARTYNIIINPNSDFTPGETVTVGLGSQDRYVTPNSGSDSYSFTIAADSQKPSTKADPDGGMFTGKVTVTLITDKGKIYYRTDEGVWKEYTGEITIDKTSKLEYYSDDNGNKEEVKSAMFYIKRPFIATGAGKTGNPHVKTFDYKGNELSSFMAFDENMRCGIRVTTGDIDADMDDEIIVGSGEGCAPHVRVFERDGTPRPIDFRPFHPDSRTGVDVATGDVDGDGKDEIAMSQYRNGETWVKVYKYNATRHIVGNFRAYRPGFEFGSTVAMGDVTNDGKAEVMSAAGPTGDPHVRVFRADGQYKGDIYAFPAYGLGWMKEDVRAGMDISTGDVDGDGKVEIAASVLGQAQSWAKVFRWNEHRNVLTEVKPYQPKNVGTNVTMGDIDQDQKAELLTGPGFGGGPHVRAFEMNKDSVWGIDFYAYDKAFRGGTDLEMGYYKY